MWLALRFPHWALDSRIETAPAAGPRLAAEQREGRRYVVAADDAALEAGVRRQMLLADARLRVAEAQVVERCPARERNALERLAGWAWHYSNRVHIAIAGDTIEASRLVLEIGASLRLFGGREALLERLTGELDAMGYRYGLGVADTPAAALAFARAPSARQRDVELARLPLACLTLEPRVAVSLRASGLRQVGELLGLPAGALVRRYGQATLDYLERLRGRRPHGLDLYRLPQRYATRHELTGAVENVNGLKFVLRRVFQSLADFLHGADAAIQSLRLTLLHDSRAPTRITLQLAAPSRSAEHFEAVAASRLGRLELAAPVVEIGLDSDRLRRYERAQGGLWQSPEADDEAWPAVLDRLRARLGEQSVYWLHGADDHRPERASRPGDRPPAPVMPIAAPRPLWLLDTPKPCNSPLTLVAGPERLETGWWQANVRRDYFRARDERGRLLWVYRDLGEAAGERPTYYVHGLFG